MDDIESLFEKIFIGAPPGKGGMTLGDIKKETLQRTSKSCKIISNEINKNLRDISKYSVTAPLIANMYHRDVVIKIFLNYFVNFKENLRKEKPSEMVKAEILNDMEKAIDYVIRNYEDCIVSRENANEK